MFAFVKDYYAALSDAPIRWRAILLHVGAPLIAGTVAIALHAPVSASRIIDVVAIISGLLFSMLILLIDVRGRVRRGDDPRAAHGDRNSLNLDYAYYSTHYAIIVGFLASAMLLLPETWWHSFSRLVQIAYNWATITVISSFALSVLHSLARLRRAYQVFGRGDN